MHVKAFKSHRLCGHKQCHIRLQNDHNSVSMVNNK